MSTLQYQVTQRHPNLRSQRQPWLAAFDARKNGVAHGLDLSGGLALGASVQGDDADLLVELGYQLSLSGTFDSAMEAYQAGARANEGDVRAMTGVVYCQVQTGEIPRYSEGIESLNVYAHQRCSLCCEDVRERLLLFLLVLGGTSQCTLFGCRSTLKLCVGWGGKCR